MQEMSDIFRLVDDILHLRSIFSKKKEVPRNDILSAIFERKEKPLEQNSEFFPPEFFKRDVITRAEFEEILVKCDTYTIVEQGLQYFLNHLKDATVPKTVKDLKQLADYCVDIVDVLRHSGSTRYLLVMEQFFSDILHLSSTLKCNAMLNFSLEVIYRAACFSEMTTLSMESLCRFGDELVRNMEEANLIQVAPFSYVDDMDRESGVLNTLRIIEHPQKAAVMEKILKKYPMFLRLKGVKEYSAMEWMTYQASFN